MKIKKFKRSSAFFMAAALCLGSTSGVYAMDESELSRIIEEAKNTDTSGYTPESCESLQAALEGAENLKVCHCVCKAGGCKPVCHTESGG